MKNLIFTLPLILISFSGQAQNSDQFTGSLLWKVTGNGLETPSYIFGTHHLAEVSFAQGLPGFNEALDAAAQVVGEIKMDDMASIQGAVMMHAAMPAGTSYATLLSEADYTLLDESLKNLLGTGLDQLGQMKPAMINVMLSMVTFAKTVPGFNPMTHVSIDQYVQNQAEQSGKKVLGMETADDQIQALFYAEPLKEQAESLVCAVKNWEHGEQSLVKLNECYAAGDLFGAYAMTFDEAENPCRMSEASASAINKNRNDKWMERLPGLFADGPAFVAVGMLHLCGQEGILYQLNQLGYTVEAVK